MPTTAQGGGFKFAVPFNTFKTIHVFEQLSAQRKNKHLFTLGRIQIHYSIIGHSKFYALL
jgi:hypothetical protein